MKAVQLGLRENLAQFLLLVAIGATLTIATLTFASGAIAAVRMRETLRSTAQPSAS